MSTYTGVTYFQKSPFFGTPCISQRIVWVSLIGLAMIIYLPLRNIWATSAYDIYQCQPKRPPTCFYLATQLCQRGLGSRNSVRLSVRCHTRALWKKQTIHCGYFDTTRKINHSSFLTPTVVGGRRPLPSEICA